MCATVSYLIDGIRMYTLILLFMLNMICGKLLSVYNPSTILGSI